MRLGLHANSNGQTDLLLRYVREVQPPVVLLLDAAPDVCRRIKQASPRTKIIGRVVWQPQTRDARRAFTNRVLDKARENRGLVDYWVGYNEDVSDGADERTIAAFAQDEVLFAKALNAEGFGALIGGFSTGVLDDGKLFAFKEALDYIVAVGPEKCALHWHEYAACYVGYNVKTRDGKNQWPDGGGFTGPSTDPSVWTDTTLRGWLTLRYRDIRPLLVKNGWGSVTGYITEFGIDNTNKNPAQWNGWAPLGSGWRNYKGTNWERIAGMGTWPEQAGWYCWQVSHDPWIKGVVGFGWADATEDDEWWAFDDSQDLDYLERTIQVQKALPFGPIGAPVEPPTGGTPPVAIENLLSTALGGLFRDDRAKMRQHPTRRFSSRALSLVRWLAIHHSAGSKDQTVQSIADYHVLTNDWAGIGYHFVVRGGYVHYVGDIGLARANVGGHNHEVIGICVTGNYDDSRPGGAERLDEADKTALRALVAQLDVFLGRKVTLAGHGSLPDQATACPGDNLQAFIPLIRAGAPPPPPATDALDARALEVALGERRFSPNRDAALTKAMVREGFSPMGNEQEFVVGGTTYVCQPGVNLTTGREAAFYCAKGDWGRVRAVHRP